MWSVILSEYRYDGKSCIIERINDRQRPYRVTTCKRYKTKEEAQKAYLNEIPKPSQDYYTRLIAENDIK